MLVKAFFVSPTGKVFQTEEGLRLRRFRLVTVTCDLPARAMVVGMKNFNGISAYLYCYHRATTVGDDHLHRYWPYNPDTLDRTHASIIRDISEAVHSMTPVRL
jgi:hypothetical protein